MLEGRIVEFEEESMWWPYEHQDRETGQQFASPFEVAVLTVDQKPLGPGKVIGMIGDASDGMPVIEVEDLRAPSGKVQILGSECWWVPLGLDPELPRLTDLDFAKNGVSAYEYVQQLDQSSIASTN